ncbi:hypothetical protein [Chitinophaga vietnamensis]|uniref:hypothetical protein n=1 Tax=Chitinophaga vietnamensis TaxID=2593957 RepID=UPI001178778D|nr:hypothetical protein [Chitinophaga vietnamensis]
MHWTKVSILCFLGALFLVANNATAQDNSPYSRYGLGDLNNNQNIVNRGMGGVSQAYGDPQSVNYINPASYSNLVLTTLDIGVEGGSRSIRDKQASFNSGFGTLSYLQLGIPLKKKWGMNIGLRPVTRVSYNIQQPVQHTFFDTTKLPVSDIFEGSGGLYQVYLGTGVGIGNFSIGVNAGYLFGSIENNSRVIYPDNTIFASRHMSRISYSSFFYKVGVQYKAKLNKEMDLSFGATGSLKQSMGARQESLTETLLFNGSTNDYTNQDTVKYAKGENGKVIYPAEFGGGILLRKLDKWSLGVDFNTTQWGNDFQTYGRKDSVQNSWKLAIGGQFVPNINALSGYWNRVAYRLGAYYGLDYVKLYGQNMPALGFTLGAGLPVRRMPYSNQYSMINVAFEVAHRGNTNTVLQENVYRVSLGFTLSDRWFIKRKYD